MPHDKNTQFIDKLLQREQICSRIKPEDELREKIHTLRRLKSELLKDAEEAKNSLDDHDFARNATLIAHGINLTCDISISIMSGKTQTTFAAGLLFSSVKYAISPDGGPGLVASAIKKNADGKIMIIKKVLKNSDNASAAKNVGKGWSAFGVVLSLFYSARDIAKAVEEGRARKGIEGSIATIESLSNKLDEKISDLEKQASNCEVL